MPATKSPQKSPSLSQIPTIPQLEHAKAAALGTLVSSHSRRAYKNAIDKFITWYCSEPQLGFNQKIAIAGGVKDGHRESIEGILVSHSGIWLQVSWLTGDLDHSSRL